MKELSIEEKAKRYDEAIKLAKDSYNYPSYPGFIRADVVFPELKESEDERIIKAIKSAVLQLTDIYLQEKYGLKQSDCITWLEKQGEHANFRNKIQIGDKVTRNKDGVLVNLSQLKRVAKPADKVEPKFQEGDWVVSPNGVYWHIDKISNSRYEVTADTGESSNWNLDTNIYHKFNIQDAKAGDVLTTKAGGIFIYKELLYDKPFAYCGVDKFGVFKDCNCGDGLDWTPYLNDVTPATKEQRDLLFQKMKEAGYEWDAEHKQLKKIEEKPTDKQFTPEQASILNKHIDKFLEQKPAWSEEDEEHLNSIISDIKTDMGAYPRSQEAIDIYNDDISFLKSLKDRIQLQNGHKSYKRIKPITTVYSQNRWKPSDEQIKVLEFFIPYVTKCNVVLQKSKDTLLSLLSDLKKLREE